MYDGTLGTRGPWQALVTFQQLIILADRDGVVDMTPEAIARRTTIPLEIITKGLEMLEQPDPDSRSPDEEGRRIVRLSDTRSWGWAITNYAKYRQIRTADDRRAYMRKYQRDRRAKLTAVNSVNTRKQNKPIAEAEAYAEAERGMRSRGSRLPPDWQPCEDLKAWTAKERPDLDLERTIEKFRDYWTAKPGKAGMKLDWMATFRNWVREERRGNGSGPLRAAPEPARKACAHCRRPLGVGFTRAPAGDVCNTCWDSYMRGQWS